MPPPLAGNVIPEPSWNRVNKFKRLVVLASGLTLAAMTLPFWFEAFKEGILSADKQSASSLLVKTKFVFYIFISLAFLFQKSPEDSKSPKVSKSLQNSKGKKGEKN